MMVDKDFREMVQARREELAELIRQREEMDMKIARLQRSLADISAMIDESEETDALFDLGLSSLQEACRAALKSSNAGVTAKKVRDIIAQFRFPIAEHKNPMASIHAVLKRLEEKGETEKGTNQAGETIYRWVPERFRKQKGKK